MALSLAVLLFKFLMMLWDFMLHAAGSKDFDIIPSMLSLIEVTLIGNLILIVMFSGYEKFVSKIERNNPDWPDWMTKVDFGA